MLFCAHLNQIVICQETLNRPDFFTSPSRDLQNKYSETFHFGCVIIAVMNSNDFLSPGNHVLIISGGEVTHYNF